MNFTVIGITVKTVNKAGSRNNGQKYCELRLQEQCLDDDGNPYAGEIRLVPVFDAEAQEYMKHVSVANGGMSQTGDVPLEPQLRDWKYCFDMEFGFPEPMVRVDENGNPQRNKFGDQYIRSSVVVLCRYKLDRDRQLLDPTASPLAPRKGWDVKSRGTSVMNAFYRPLRIFNAILENGGGGAVNIPPQQNAGGVNGGTVVPPGANTGNPF